jgi:hypothetical protein
MKFLFAYFIILIQKNKKNIIVNNLNTFYLENELKTTKKFNISSGNDTRINNLNNKETDFENYFFKLIKKKKILDSLLNNKISNITKLNLLDENKIFLEEKIVRQSNLIANLKKKDYDFDFLP